MILGRCDGQTARFLVFTPHGVEDGEQDGKADAQNPGEVPHDDFSYVEVPDMRVSVRGEHVEP